MNLPSTSIEEEIVDLAVRKNCKYINRNGGFVVSGYYKCGNSQADGDKQVTLSLTRAVIVSIQPVTSVPPEKLYVERLGEKYVFNINIM